jgi:hypothetical protein
MYFMKMTICNQSTLVGDNGIGVLLANVNQYRQIQFNFLPECEIAFIMTEIPKGNSTGLSIVVED